MPLYELEGSSFASTDRYGHLCSATGTVTTPQGKAFDGIDDTIFVPDDILLGRSPPWTLELWGNMVANQASGSFGGTLYSCAQAAWIQIFIDRVTLNIRIATSTPSQNVIIVNTAMTTGTFHHLVISCAGPGTNETSVYFDGNLSGQTTINTVVTGNTTERIGWDGNPGSQLNGYIAEVVVYDRALLQPDVTANYEATKWRYR